MILATISSEDITGFKTVVSVCHDVLYIDKYTSSPVLDVLYIDKDTGFPPHKIFLVDVLYIDKETGFPPSQDLPG